MDVTEICKYVTLSLVCVETTPLCGVWSLLSCASSRAPRHEQRRRASEDLPRNLPP